MKNKSFEVIIIGGSFAGLSAAMTLARSLRNVLIIDSGNPCNTPSPHSHNFITHDGVIPKELLEKARNQVLQYPTVEFLLGKAVKASTIKNMFEVSNHNGESFSARKLLLTTGVSDTMPPINGFAECWGRSILHCPYCHGYEVRGKKIALLGNGILGFDLSKMLYHWSSNIILLTNGQSSLSEEQIIQLKNKNIPMNEIPIDRIEQVNGQVKEIILKDGTRVVAEAIFTKPDFRQHSSIPQELGCELLENGLIKIDNFQITTIPGVFAAGDNSNAFRAISLATASGTGAGAFINRELIEENF